MTVRDRLPIALTVLSMGVLLAALVGGAAGGVIFGALAMAFAPVLMLLGVADREGRLGSPALPIVALLVVLEAGCGGLWVFRGRLETGPWFLGLPAATAILIYGLLLVPLVVVTLGFALTFREVEVEPEKLEALRRLAPPSDG